MPEICQSFICSFIHTWRMASCNISVSCTGGSHELCCRATL